MNDKKKSIDIAEAIFKKMMPEHSKFQVNEISNDSANDVYAISLDGDNKFLLKIYKQNIQRAVASKEKVIYQLMNGQTDHIATILHHGTHEDNEFIIVPFIKGIELLKIIQNIDTRPEKLKFLSKQMYTYIEDCTQNVAEGYGSLNNDGIGTSSKWKDFLENNIKWLDESLEIVMQVCEGYWEFLLFIIKSLKQFVSEYKDYFDSIQSKLTPVDLNLCNFIVTNEDKLFAIDLESFVAGDPLIAYGELMGHIYDSSFEKYFSFLWDNWSDFQKNIVHFYSLLSNLNVFIFCALQENKDPTGFDLGTLCPWGNPNTFIHLMTLHQKAIEARLTG